MNHSVTVPIFIHQIFTHNLSGIISSCGLQVSWRIALWICLRFFHLFSPCVMRFNLSLKYFITKHLTLLFLSTNFPTKNFLQISCKLSQFSLNLLNINKLAKQMKCWMFYKYQLNKAIKNYRRCLILIQIKQKRYKGNIQVGKS